MESGICPKCEAKEVHIYRNYSAELSISVGFLSAANLNYYICTNCGYVEMFVREKSLLPKIAEKYPKVN